jgi:hypothetical protein
MPLRWISYVDEYGPTLHYVEGPLNIIADTLSRLSRNDNDSSALVGKKAASVVSDSESTAEHSSVIDDREILKCLLNLPCCLLIVLFTIPTVVVLSMCIGVGGCGCHSLARTSQNTFASCAFRKSAPSLASAVDAATSFRMVHVT